MARIIAFANQKGGVAKTTTAINLGAALAERGKKVLIVDADPQANLTVGIGLDPLDLKTTISNILQDENRHISEAIYDTSIENLKVVPSDIDLSDVEFSLIHRFSRETILRSAIDPELGKLYDYILLDAPPSLGMLTINVLDAAREVIIPVATHFYALQGLTTLLARLELIQKKINPDLKVCGLLATRHVPRTNLGREVIQTLHSFSYPVFKTVIHEAIRVAEAPAMGKTILDYQPKGISAEQYRQLADEIDGKVQ
jgi:chromosome partitioning protein